MSSGMLLLAGLFATGPVTAPPCETAPMPRAKRGAMQLEFRFDVTPRGLTFGAGVGPAKPASYLVEAGRGVRIQVPPLGANPSVTLPQHVPAPVQEARTGRFMVGGGVNSNAGVCGDIVLMERNFDVARLQSVRPEPQVLVCPGPVNGPPPEVHAMMLQAIEQMSGPVAAAQPPMCLPPVPAQVAWVAPAQMGRPMPMGSWTREVGPVRYKLEIKDHTLTVTTTLTEEDDDGKVVSIDHMLTADWYPTRNAGEIIGLVTGFDIATNGKAMKRDDVGRLLGSLADIQKQLSGKPIALTCRVSDGTLSIGDVRLPVLRDDYEELSSAFAAMGGNYKPAVVATPPAAINVVPAGAGGRMLSSPRPLQRELQYIPYETFPITPDQPQRIGVDFNFNPLRFHGYPPMPPPLPLPKSNPFRDGSYNPLVPATWPNPFRDGYFIW